ncbi:MAG: MBL fold metallo-hydrolase [Chloroflexi bacterium]|nr:MBL fold metallo-hydrolase [Chloroflexota bacterium]
MPVRHLWDEIYQITTPTPFPVGDVHAYLLKADPLTLIDSGVGNKAGKEAMQAALAELGLQLHDIEQIVISHSHADHMGQVRWLQQASQARVLAHPRSCAKLADIAAYAQQAVVWIRTILSQAGVPADRLQKVQDFYRHIPQLAASVTVDQCITEGDRLEVGGHTWQVQYCPGHSADLNCFYDPRRRLLIASDHLLPHISSNALLEPPRSAESQRRRPLLEYWQSLERTASLSLDWVLPGHGELIHNPRLLLARRRQQRDRRLAAILTSLVPAPLTAWQIAQELFPHLAGVDVYLAISEVVGHMDMLIAQGQAQQIADDAFLYQRCS